MKFLGKCVLVIFSGATAACGSTPKSIREYANTLPARADGQYAALDDQIRKQLVLMDAMLQCKIDVEDKKNEEESGACKCNKSSSVDWKADCQPWLKDHTPSTTSNVGSAGSTGSGSN